MSFLYSFFSGESVKDVIVLTGQDDNIDGVRRLLHQSILHANVVGMPKGQALTSTSTGMIYFLILFVGHMFGHLFLSVCPFCFLLLLDEILKTLGCVFLSCMGRAISSFPGYVYSVWIAVALW